MGRSLSVLRVVLATLIVGGFMIWVGWYVYAHHEEFSIIRQISWVDLLVLYIAFSAMIVCNGMFVHVVVNAFHIRLKPIEWLALSVASSFANLFLPFRGGAALRALYLAKLYRLPVTDFITTLSVMYLMHTVVNGLLALIGMTLVVFAGGPLDMPLAISVSLATVVGLAVMQYNFHPAWVSRRFPLKQLYQILEGWRQVRARSGLIARLWVLTLFFSLATAWLCKLAFSAIFISLPWSGAFLYAASKNLAFLASITPGSFGIVEGVSIYLGRVLDYTIAQALLVEGLIRAVAISTLLVVGPLAVLLLKRRIASFDQKSPVSDKQLLQ